MEDKPDIETHLTQCENYCKDCKEYIRDILLLTCASDVVSQQEENGTDCDYVSSEITTRILSLFCERALTRTDLKHELYGETDTKRKTVLSVLIGAGIIQPLCEDPSLSNKLLFLNKNMVIVSTYIEKFVSFFKNTSTTKVITFFLIVSLTLTGFLNEHQK